MTTIVYLIYGYAQSNKVLFFSALFLLSSGVVVYHLIPLVKEWGNTKTELAQWTLANPKESLIMASASIAASVLIFIFYLWPYIDSGFLQSSPRDIKALLFGITGALIFFVIGRILLKMRNNK